MAININAKTTGVGGLETSADNSGNINIQSGGTTVMSVTSSGVAVTGSFSQNGAVYSTQPSFRNLIINGDMRIAQRGASTSSITTSGYYTVDRYRQLLASGGTWTQSQDTDVPSGQGFATSLKMDCTTANASLSAGSNAAIVTRLEGQNLQHLKKGTASAESLTLSFWVKANKTGTLTASLFDSDNTRWISKSYTIDVADTWEQKTITFAGDTTGAFDNDNAASLHLYMWLLAGTDYTSGTLATSWESYIPANAVASSQVNLADSTSNYINITGVQLEVGSTATDFENLPYDVSLARCQRYLPALNGSYWTATGYNIINNIGVAFIKFPVTARVPATGISFSSLSHFTVANNTNTSYTPTGISFDVSNIEGGSILFSTSTGLTQGDPSRIYASNGSAQLLFNGCEL